MINCRTHCLLRCRRKKETWELEDVSRTEVDRRVMEENKQKMLRQLEHDEKRRVMFKKLEHFQAKQAAKNLLVSFYLS